MSLLERKRTGTAGLKLRKRPWENQMHKQKRESDAQGGKESELPKHEKISQAEGAESPHGGQDGNQPDAPDFMGGLPAIGSMGTVQKQKVGNAVVDGDRNNGTAETENHD